MDHGIRERLEDGATSGDVRFLAADHHEELALRRRHPSAADRRVDDRDTALGGPLGEPPTRIGMDRGVDRHDAARHPGEHAVGAHEHVLDVGVGHHTDPDDVARRTERSGRRSHDGGGVAKWLHGPGAARPDRERKAFLRDASGDRRPLAAQSDEADACHRSVGTSASVQGRIEIGRFT